LINVDVVVLLEQVFDPGELVKESPVDDAYVALKLVLDELAIAPGVQTVADRKTLQKVVYLGQAAGVDLGYRYNWYRMGPYSPGLTRDYFGLAEAIQGGEKAEAFELQRAARERLDTVKSLLRVPAEVELGLADWLELLASVHFLMTRRRLSRERVDEVLQKEKGHVAEFAPQATRQLEDVGLVSA
jgi:hypothetical protein